ncbi:hypothetical protein [uncultured Corynebacterium sp.]|uniref:hypothetical protein n=1 Tax=uncultured Corynebacterium sp. TaxID=159447 RepID=UPI0025D6BD34|nr:hypothetical protein [uncultured Corynebacterium sp.]
MSKYWAATVCGLAASALLVACSRGGGVEESKPPARSTNAAHAGAFPASIDQKALKRAVAVATEKFGGDVGVAVATPDELMSAGTTTGFAAWSTAKVPIAIAACQAGTADPDLVEAAITYSDNDSAQALWVSLGAAETAVEQTQAVLREGGDTVTEVQGKMTRGGFTPFGQTEWGLKEQATFAAQLPEVDDADSVIEAMRTPDPLQDYGLRAIPGAAIKGGWGPDDDGFYSVVQLGHVKLDGKEIGMAVFSRPEDGTYEAAQEQLDYLVYLLTGEKTDKAA